MSLNLSSLDSLIDSADAGSRPSYLAVQSASIWKPVEGCANPELHKFIKPIHGTTELLELKKLLEDRGTFEVAIDRKSGLVRTSDLEGDENWEMGSRQWVTDTVRSAPFCLRAGKEIWFKALNTLVSFYNTPDELSAFSHSIKDPAWYREGGLKNGVAHIFIPGTLRRDTSWSNNKRLESHGLALCALCGFLIEDLSSSSSQLLAESEATRKNWLCAVSNLSQYLSAIEYWSAPSAGNWEERPFPGGLTWDTEAIRAAFESLQKLLSSVVSSQALSHFREGLVDSDTTGTTENLEDLIRRGEEKVRRRLREPAEHPDRAADSSLAFISASTISLADNLSDDVKAHFNVLNFLDKELVREFGIIRYAPFSVKLHNNSVVCVPDSYLNKNYWIAFNKQNEFDTEWLKQLQDFGSKDASEDEVFVKRAEFSTEGKEAQWFMVSDLATGFAKQTIRLLQNGEPSNELVQYGREKSHYFLNKALSRITPDSDLVRKSNGNRCPGWKVPEAYEYVSCLRPEVDSALVPGVNTPLAWASVSLYGAIEAAISLENLLSDL